MPGRALLARCLPDIFTRLTGVRRDGMTWKTYCQLKGKDIELKAWRSIAHEVAKEIAGEDVIPNPFLDFTESPCEPGLLIFNIDRTFKEWFSGKPRPAITSELVWDFYPRWALTKEVKPMKVDTHQRNENHLYTKKCSFTPRSGGGKKKSVSVQTMGRSFCQLNDPGDLEGRIINMELFEDSIFDDANVYIVDKVFYVDSFHLRFRVDDEVKASKIENGRFPVGFTVRKVRIGWANFDTRCIKHVSRKSKRKMNVSWVHRTRFSYFFRQGIANGEKYGAAAGDFDRYRQTVTVGNNDVIG